MGNIFGKKEKEVPLAWVGTNKLTGLLNSRILEGIQESDQIGVFYICFRGIPQNLQLRGNGMIMRQQCGCVKSKENHNCWLIENNKMSLRFWDAAVIHEYKMEENKQVYTQKLGQIYLTEKGTYVISYDDEWEEEDSNGIITVEAQPISQTGSRIQYQGKFELQCQETFLSADIFSIQMTGRWDGLRAWEILLGENDVKLEFELGYYASLLKADADAKAYLNFSSTV